MKKRERNCKECRTRTREYPGLREPKSAAGRGELGGEPHSPESEPLKQLLPMKRRKKERQALVPSQQAVAISLQYRSA